MSRPLLVGLLLVAVIIFGITIYSASTQNDPETEIPAVDETDVGYVPDVVNAKHQVKGSTHVIAGEAEVPTPCDLLSADAEVAQNERDVLIAFTTMNQSEMCAQVITAARFKVTFEALPSASIRATWNGREVRLNVMEVGPDEDLEDFDIYIKG